MEFVSRNYTPTIKSSLRLLLQVILYKQDEMVLHLFAALSSY
jgi:hypothetical protein